MTGEVVDKDLFEYALVKPRFAPGNPDRLLIVSGYATHAMAARHLIEMSRKHNCGLHVDLVYGMAGSDGVGKANHLGFISLENKAEFPYPGSFACSYVKKPKSVHSKTYVWCRGETPVRAFTGSANYSENGFNLPSRTETLAECDPASALEFFKAVKKGTVACSAADRDKDFAVKAKFVLGGAKPTSPAVTIEQDKTSPFYGHEKATVSLLTRDGGTGNGSRLNWGVRPDGSPRVSENKSGVKSVRNRDQAYVGIGAALQRSGFFPPPLRRFTVLADDGAIFTCVRAQANGKGIETPQDNAEFGRYFRDRIGVPRGAYIQPKDLRKYGRHEVTFWKLDDENYIMDFSRP